MYYDNFLCLPESLDILPGCLKAIPVALDCFSAVFFSAALFSAALFSAVIFVVALKI